MLPGTYAANLVKIKIQDQISEYAFLLMKQMTPETNTRIYIIFPRKYGRYFWMVKIIFKIERGGRGINLSWISEFHQNFGPYL